MAILITTKHRRIELEAQRIYLKTQVTLGQTSVYQNVMLEILKHNTLL